MTEPKVDYTAMSGPEFMEAVGVDAQKWADAFIQYQEAFGMGIDRDLMIGWFANALMAMHDHMQGNPPLNGDHAQYLLDKDDCITSIPVEGP